MSRDLCCVVFTLLLVIAQQPVPPPLDTPESRERLPVRIGGRIHADWTTAGGSALDAIGAARGEEVETGGEIRRARLRADWQLAEGLRFRADFDFARGDVRPREVALRWTPDPGAEWKLGFAKVPFGFERLISSNDFDLAEESVVEQAVPPGRRTGLFHTSWTEQWTASGSAYMVSDSRAQVEQGSWGAAARGVWRPWRDAEGSGLLHFGAELAWEDPDGSARFSADPGHHPLGDFLDSGKLATDAFGRYGVELAATFGPAFGLLEGFAAQPDDASGGSATVSGWTLSVGSYLTGESRAYDDAKASWARTIPLAPFDPSDPSSGPGAWELVARVGSFDLGDAAGAGEPASMEVYSVGTVWHWTAHRRWLFTLSRIDLDGFDDVYAATLRFVIDW